jgi:glycosyltransferase involved in cell wall biosynthesis
MARTSNQEAPTPTATGGDAAQPVTRVALLLGGLPVGGAEVNVVALLPRLVAQGVTPVVVTLSQDSDSFLADRIAREGCQRVNLGARRLFDVGAIRRLRAYLRSERIEVLHAEDQYSVIVGSLAVRGTDTRFVLTRHVLGHDRRPRREAVKALLGYLAARRADAVIAVSQAVRTTFASQAHLPSSRITVIHNGLDLAPFEELEDRAAARDRLAWSQTRPTISIVGVMRQCKGHDTLLDALPAIRDAFPDVVVKIVGGGDVPAELRARIDALAGTVELVGERSDIPAVLAASDIVVQASRSEGLPTVMMEAGAAGVAVVATDVGGTSDVVEDGTTGLLVPREDAQALAAAVVQLLGDPERVRSMGLNARASILQRFSLDRQAQLTADLYRTLAEGP